MPDVSLTSQKTNELDWTMLYNIIEPLRSKKVTNAVFLFVNSKNVPILIYTILPRTNL